MKKLNKLFFGFASAGAVAAPIATAVSCGSSTLSDEQMLSLAPQKVEVASTGFVTDGGSKDDKSFNQQGWEALQAIKTDADMNKDYLKSDAYDTGAINKGYEAMAARGMKTILAPGFSHIDAIKTFVKKHDNAMNFILADGEVKAGNVASIMFAIKQVAFQAGYAASNYLATKSDNDHYVGTFGGGNFPGVTDFMTGFVAGVKYFNQHKPDTFHHAIKFAQFDSDDAYTNSGFVEGAGNPNAKVLIDKKAEIILPVSGPQTAGVIDTIRTSNKNDVKVIGVDVDQSKTITGGESYFFTSIEKNVRLALSSVWKDAVANPSTVFGHTTQGTIANGFVALAPAQAADTASQTALAFAKDEKNIPLNVIAQATDLYTWSQALADLKTL